MHKCNWPTCAKQVCDSVWGCKEHFFTLPSKFREPILRALSRGRHSPSTVHIDKTDPFAQAEHWAYTYILSESGLEERETALMSARLQQSRVHRALDVIREPL